MTQAERLAAYQELKDPTLRIHRLLTDRAVAEAVLAMGKIEGAKGDKGDTPVKGKDYFTPEEIQAFVDYLRAQIKDGHTPTDAELLTLITPLIPAPVPGKKGKDGYSPVRGVDYWNKADMDTMLKAVLSKMPKIEKPTALEPKPISYKDIKDAPDVSSLPKLIRFLNEGGFRGGGDTVAAGTGINISIVNGVKTISSTGGGGFTSLPATETPNGSLAVFTFATATAQPSFLVIDYAQKPAVAKNGNVNWTWNVGTKVATLNTVGNQCPSPLEDISAIQ